VPPQAGVLFSALAHFWEIDQMVNNWIALQFAVVPFLEKKLDKAQCIFPGMKFIIPR